MTSLALTLSLTLFSFISSTFVLLRIVIPVLPPNPLSRKVPPSEFGLPNYRSLSPADKSHLCLACLDLCALGFFVWQAISTNLLSSAYIMHDPLSAVRLWIALTARETCLLFIASLTLLYVRLGRSVSFGPKHTLLWAPVLIFVVTGAVVGAVLAKVGLVTLWGGLVVYSTVTSLLTTVCFGCLVCTLVLIRRSIVTASQAEAEKEWPPLKERPTRCSIAIDDIEALKDGSSWITSHRSSGSSHRNSISAFSFSTAHHSQPGTIAPITGSAPSILPKSSYWFGTVTPNSAALVSEDSIPPVPRVPSPYRDHSAMAPNQVYDVLDDPFHRSPPRPSKSSVNSWLTSPSGSQVTLTEFSFPTTRPGSPSEQDQLTRSVLTRAAEHDWQASHSRATTVKPLSESRVLGGYGRQDGVAGLSPKASKDVDVSIFRCVVLFASIWIPLGLSLPYLLASLTHDFNSPLASILLTLSVTVPSPLLALSLLLRSPLPIPAALFSPSYSPSNLYNTVPPMSEIRIYPETRGRSTSMTVVEGRRSGDIWIANGEAIDGRSKAARILGLLVPTPRLAVLPPAGDQGNVEESTSPLPIQSESPGSVATSSPRTNGAELGAVRTRKDSKASSYWSGADESLAYNSRIMVAQRHYSAMATTVFIPPSPKRASTDTPHNLYDLSGADVMDNSGIKRGAHSSITKGHIRSRSASSLLQTPRSSLQSRFPLTPPPSSPLPPTPPNLRHLHNSNSQSSSASGFSFGPIGNTNQIDSLSAGVLPLLVPGLKVGNDIIITDSSSPPESRRSGEAKKRTPKDYELGLSSSTSFNSPEMHSTPARIRKGSVHRWKHLSLPSLGLGKDGVHSLTAWKEELVRVLDGLDLKTPQKMRTPHGDIPPIPTVILQNNSSGNVVAEEDHIQFGYAVTSDNSRIASIHPFEITPPASAPVYSDRFNTARSSMTTMAEAPQTAANALLHLTLYDQPNESALISHQHSPSLTDTTRTTHAYHLPIPPVRKSSIVYIKSDDSMDVMASQSNTHAQSQKQKPRPQPPAVKQFIPSALKASLPMAAGSPLRKLTLLSDRDLNTNISDVSTRPLVVSKKTRQGDKENSGLRPLRLARSATAKARGLLRQNEVLPDVVVRPPSSSSHIGFGYTFR